MTFSGELEFAHRLHVEVEQVGHGFVEETLFDGPVLVVHVPWLEDVLGDVFHPEASVFDVAVQLGGVAFTAPVIVAIAAAGATDVVGDVVSVVLVFLGAVFIDETWQAKPATEVAERGLEAFDVAVGLHHWPADGVGDGVGLADRAIQERDAACRAGSGRRS